MLFRTTRWANRVALRPEIWVGAWAVGLTLLSLLLNSMAGYAFAKFRFPGRDRLFRTLLAALVLLVAIVAVIWLLLATSRAERARELALYPAKLREAVGKLG